MRLRFRANEPRPIASTWPGHALLRPAGAVPGLSRSSEPGGAR